MGADVAEVTAERLGVGVCVLRVGAYVREPTSRAVDDLAGDAVVDGCWDFVFDLTAVGRYETPALRALADLWRRLNGMGCAVFVAARNPAVVDCLHRVIPARGTWTLTPTLPDALTRLLTAPV